VGTDRTAPYAMKWRASKRMSFRSHTVTVRAISVDGGVSSWAITVKRVHTARAAATGARSGWRLASRPTATGTALRGRGIARHRVVAYLTRCDDQRARVVRRIRMRAGRDGSLRADPGEGNLCVLRVRPV
jgi:hypothetical protein